MSSVQYVTDNPYRLLGVRSSISYKELRQKANMAVQAAKVGLSTEIGLESVFGAEKLPDVPSLILTLANDPKLRTIYRLFWPFEYEKHAGANGTLDEIDHLLSSGAQDDRRWPATHLRFLRAWFGQDRVPHAMGLAIECFADLCNDEGCDDYLAQLLHNDGDCDDVHDCVSRAQEEIADHLLRCTCRRAAELWEAGDSHQSALLLQMVHESRFSDEWIDRALTDVVGAGERGMVRLRQLSEDFTGWLPERHAQLAAECEKLLQFADAVKGRLPAAASWIEAVDDYIARIAFAMRDYAVDLANEKDDYLGAIRILGQAQALSLPPAVHEKIEDDLSQLHRMVDEQQRCKDVRRINGPPMLFTINGVGLSLSGRAPFAGRPGCYVATYYFVVLFIPIIPITRYLVSDAPGGGWHFHGQLPLTSCNRYHLFGVLAAVLCWLLWTGCFDDPNGVDAASPKTPNSVSVPPSDSPPPASNVLASADRPSKGTNTTVADNAPALSLEPTTSSKPAARQPEASVAQPVVQRVGGMSHEQSASERRHSQLLAEHERMVQRINSGASKLSVMSSAIDSERQKLATEERAVDQAQRELSTEGEAIAKASRARDAASARIDSERIQLDHTNEEAVSAFNEMVDQYNSVNEEIRQSVNEYNVHRTEYNRRLGQFSEHQAEFNRRVRAHNARVERRRRDIERVHEIERALEEMRH